MHTYMQMQNRPCLFIQSVEQNFLPETLLKDVPAAKHDFFHYGSSTYSRAGRCQTVRTYRRTYLHVHIWDQTNIFKPAGYSCITIYIVYASRDWDQGSWTLEPEEEETTETRLMNRIIILKMRGGYFERFIIKLSLLDLRHLHVIINVRNFVTKRTCYLKVEQYGI